MSAPLPATTSAEPLRLCTAGYEGAGVVRFLETLAEARIALLIDVRFNPWSRNSDFTKRALADHLTGAGIDYLHLSPLGSPDALRAVARSGDRAAYRAGYFAHLQTPAATAARIKAVARARGRRVALMCMEADPVRCHRSLLALLLAAEHGFEIFHLSTARQVAFDF